VGVAHLGETVSFKAAPAKRGISGQDASRHRRGFGVFGRDRRGVDGVGLWCGQSVRSSISSNASRAGWPNTSCGVNGAGWLAKPCLVPKH